MSENQDEWNWLGKKGSYQRIVVTSLSLGLLALFVVAARAAFAGKTLAAALLHGMAIPLSIGTTLFFLLIGLIGRSSFHRKVGGFPNGDPSWRILGMIIATLVAVGSFVLVQDYSQMADVVKSGIHAEARLIGESGRDCSKYGCFVEIEYAFTPPGRDQSIKGVAKIHAGSSRSPSEEYDYIVNTGRVPIIYNRNDPVESIFSWKKNIERRGSVEELVKRIAVWTAIVLAGVSPLVVGTWWITRKRAAERNVTDD